MCLSRAPAGQPECCAKTSCTGICAFCSALLIHEISCGFLPFAGKSKQTGYRAQYSTPHPVCQQFYRFLQIPVQLLPEGFALLLQLRAESPPAFSVFFQALLKFLPELIPALLDAFPVLIPALTVPLCQAIAQIPEL